MGYGMQFEPRPHGPIVTKVFGGGEAHRTGLIQEGDVLTEVNGASISEDALGPPAHTLVSLSTGVFVLFKSLASSLLPAASFQRPLHGVALLLAVVFPS
jgi:hypothetical protein